MRAKIGELGDAAAGEIDGAGESGDAGRADVMGSLVQVVVRASPRERRERRCLPCADAHGLWKRVVSARGLSAGRLSRHSPWSDDTNERRLFPAGRAALGLPQIRQ
jgi:hypothetical protein